MMFVVESGWHLVNYRWGTITYNEFKRKVQRAGLANGSSWIGGCIGGAIGLVFGPIGVGIGAGVGGMIGDYCARDVFDKTIPNLREDHIQKALRRFGYGDMRLDDLLRDPKQFNKEILEKRYHQNAKFHHPDAELSKPDYDYLSTKEKQDRWMEFYSMYDALLIILKQQTESKSNKKKD